MDGSESTLILLERARLGDDAALNDLCARYLPRLERWAHGRLPAWARGPLDTHDLVQEALARTAGRIRDFTPNHEGSFQAYVRQALLNRVRDRLREAGRRPTQALETDRVSDEPSPLERAIGQQALERYEAALARLGPDHRQAIILRLELGCPWTEVAEVLQKPSAAAARMVVVRALVRLAEEMSKAPR